MEILFKQLFSMEYYIMVKVKVVDVIQSPEEPEQPQDIQQPAAKPRTDSLSPEEQTAEPVVAAKEDEVSLHRETVPEVPTLATPDETKTTKKKTAPTGKCDHCGKEMLMKTLKYSHMKLCIPPAPPPPPPVVEKPKPKRAPPKPKPQVAVSPEPTVAAIQKPTFDGVVDFGERKGRTQDELFQQMRQERLQRKQARVKSLISQAI